MLSKFNYNTFVWKPVPSFKMVNYFCQKVKILF